MNPYTVVRDFEKALCDYTGAPYAVTVTSCTMALLLAVRWRLQRNMEKCHTLGLIADHRIEIPKRTYVSVPMSIVHAGGCPIFREEEWLGAYQLAPLPVIDSARWFTSGMYEWMAERVIGHDPGRSIVGRGVLCCSFHWTKTLSIGQGGVILHDSPEADEWFRRARFDGRNEGVAPKNDTFNMLGWHCYMSPRDAAEGLSRLAVLPKHNAPLPNDDYLDLSQLEIFK